MPIQLNNKNGTQIYHREGGNTSKFSIFGSDHPTGISYGYVEVADVPRNNYGFYTRNDDRPERYYKEGIVQLKTQTEAPVWTLAEIDQNLIQQKNTQQTEQKPVIEKENGHTKDHSKKFVWPYGGDSVYLTGTFDNWQTSIPMTPVNDADINGRVFEVTVDNLDLSKDNTYKFVVDGKWCYDVKKDFVVDASGNVNNIIYAEV
ncbi:unnamed protein product [Mucor hiemalis]